MTSRRYIQLRHKQLAVAARQRRMLPALERWMRGLARAAVQVETHRWLGSVAKAEQPFERFEVELYELLMRYGVRSIADAANDQGEVIVPSADVAQAVAGKPVRIKWFYELIAGQYRSRVYESTTSVMQETLDGFRRSVHGLIAASTDEVPRPGSGELARRIRNIAYGSGDRCFAFSSARAALIARTESLQSYALGHAEGVFADSDPDDEIEWMSHPGGGRGHDLMNGARITVADSQSSDPSRWFKLPDGARMPYPGYPDAPIKHTANCRCDFAVVQRAAGAGGG